MRSLSPGPLFIVLFFLSQAAMVFAFEGESLVTGKVVFGGLVPAVTTELVKVDEDVCGKQARIQAVQVDEATSGLRSVVVSVTKNVPSVPVDSATSKRMMVNAKCAFVPNVGAARVGDILEIHNQDPILHNTHIKMGKKTFLNVAQVPNSRPIPKVLKRTGLHVFRCDKHTFMTGTLLVFNHPYFAVTDELGYFQLPALPAGTYTIAVWHETLGSLEQEVAVPSHGSVTINFDYL
jgi:plastocyanin